MRQLLLSWIFLSITTVTSHAGEAEIVGVEIEKQQSQSYTFRVTVSHQDEGWDHYADRWDIIGPDGTVLASRILHHPHVDEQPFTRSLSGVKIPESIDKITVRAHDNVHGLGMTTPPISLSL